MSSLLSNLLDLIRKEIPSERAVVLLMDKNNQVLFKKSRPLFSVENDEIRLEIVKRALKRGNPVVTGDKRHASCLEKEIIDDHKKQGSVLCLPFVIDGGTSGAICLERRQEVSLFSHQDLELLISFLNPIRLIIEKSIDFRRFKEKPSQIVESALVGNSEAFHRIVSLIEKVKDRDEPVFICGESGTGKELVARSIHQRGARKKGKFIAVNCGAIPEFLLESELFGHVRGAFTGAVRDKPGLIEEADGGTFFLDEIGDLSPHLQAKLLRLLQEREIRRIGENHTRRVNVRFISATNKNIEDEMKKGNFREDLYYRLEIITIKLTPLRERKEDLLFLLNYFLRNYCREMKREQAYFSPRALELLINYEWPGNARELQSEIQRCLILLGEDCLIKEETLSSKINPLKECYRSSSYDFFQAKAEFEKRFLNQALARWNYNRAKTAEEIGLSRQGLFKLIKKHHILLPKKKKGAYNFGISQSEHEERSWNKQQRERVSRSEFYE